MKSRIAACVVRDSRKERDVGLPWKTYSGEQRKDAREGLGPRLKNAVCKATQLLKVSENLVLMSMQSKNKIFLGDAMSCFAFWRDSMQQMCRGLTM